MQTDSLLTKHARKLIAWWADNSETSDSGSIARELSRLEQENQRLTREISDWQLRSFGLSAFASVPEDAHVQTDRDVIARLEQENQRLADELANADANVRVLSDCRGLDEHFRALSRTELKAKNADLATTRDALTAARAEVQRLRENAEMDQAQRAEWQATIDKLEAENARIRNQLRLALIISDPGKVDAVMERIGKLEARSDIGLRSQVATLEGRLQGVIETVKLELALLRNRVDVLEVKAR